MLAWSVRSRRSWIVSRRSRRMGLIWHRSGVKSKDSEENDSD
jgi:hypothetical protein